jgi:ABC-type transport system substrate-binding protein
VAFTVNTALAFRLGFDWQAFYDPEWLDHAEATDAKTVTFYFKRAPDVATWQYGALQGPVVQKKFWMARVAEAEALLAPANSPRQIELLKERITELQQRVDTLRRESVTATGEQAREIQVDLLHREQDLGQTYGDLGRAQDAFDNSMHAARTALYALDASGEPTLGNWMPAGKQGDTWINEANAARPFAAPHFDRAIYQFYAEEESAFAALETGDVNAVLEPRGLSLEAMRRVDRAELWANPSSSVQLLVINPSRKVLAEGALRRALSCAVDRETRAAELNATPLDHFVLPDNQDWFSPRADELR